MIRILCDSVASLSKDTIEKRNIDVISLSVNMDGNSYLEIDMDIDKFNAELSNRINNIPTSSQPSTALFENYFEECATSGDSVIGIFMSSELSSTFDGALRAARMVKLKNPSFQCTLIDSFAACAPQSFSVLDACDARDDGKSYAEIVKSAATAVLCSRIMFAPHDLSFLVAGGRLNATVAKMATKLKVSPIISTIDGRADSFAKVRTYKKALDKMVEILKNDIEKCELKRIVVHYAGIINDEVRRFAERISDLVNFSVELVSVSPVLSVHAGPAIGIGYECKLPIIKKFTKKDPKIVYYL